MKKLFILCMLLPLISFGQEQMEAPPTLLYETVNITVKSGQEKAFEAAVKEHNTKFHGEGLYRARLFYNINGPFGGTYTWVMGPTNYTAMDDRPGEGVHNDDWTGVAQYVEKFGSPSYWTMDEKLSQINTEVTNDKRLIWVYDIKPGQYKRWMQLVGQVKEVYEAKRADETFVVVMNDFANSKEGMDAAVIFAFDKWAWMDQKSTFAMQYEEVHGPGSWHHFLNEFSETVDGRIDWIRFQVN